MHVYAKYNYKGMYMYTSMFLSCKFILCLWLCRCIRHNYTNKSIDRSNMYIYIYTLARVYVCMSSCLYFCLYACMHACMCVYVRICVCHMCICAYMHVLSLTDTHTRTSSLSLYLPLSLHQSKYDKYNQYIQMYICLYVCMSVCMYVSFFGPVIL